MKFLKMITMLKLSCARLKFITVPPRALDKVRIFISKCPFLDHLLESSHRDDSNKWPNIAFGQEITQVVSIEVNFTHLICTPPPALICSIKLDHYPVPYMCRHLLKPGLWRNVYRRPWLDAVCNARRLIRAYNICRSWTSTAVSQCSFNHKFYHKHVKIADLGGHCLLLK